MNVLLVEDEENISKPLCKMLEKNNIHADAVYDGLSGYIASDGKIHTTLNQTITATGRLSSTEPNLQNIPIRIELGKLIRKVFLPEDGDLFVDSDYSQIELRVLAALSG